MVGCGLAWPARLGQFGLGLDWRGLVRQAWLGAARTVGEWLVVVWQARQGGAWYGVDRRVRLGRAGEVGPGTDWLGEFGVAWTG